MESPNPDRVDAWLAGHADWELDAATRQRVEEWLAADPQAAEILRDQESLSPRNLEFWAAVEPPTVSNSKWDAVGFGIASRCPASVPKSIWNQSWLKAVLVVSVAAGIAGVVFSLQKLGEPNRELAQPSTRPTIEVAPEPRSPTKEDPLAEYAVLPITQPGEVFIESVRGGVSPIVLGPSQPVPTELTLAGSQDIQVESIRPTTANGSKPDVKVTTEPGGVTMIYASLPQ